MNFKALPIVIMILLISHMGLACSCSNIPKTFKKNIHTSHVILKGKIQKHIDAPEGSYFNFGATSLTEIKVEKYYQNQLATETIYYRNGQGSACKTNISHLEPGATVILKAVKTTLVNRIKYQDSLDQTKQTFLDTYSDKTMIEYYICDVSLLHVEGESVVGPWSKNLSRRGNRIVVSIYRLSPKVGQWARSVRDLRKREPQVTRLDKVERKLKKRA